MKKKGLIISTVVMVVVLIASLTTATYAWFSTSATAAIDQLNVQTKASEGLQIGHFSLTDTAFTNGKGELDVSKKFWKNASGQGLASEISFNTEALKFYGVSGNGVDGSMYKLKDDGSDPIVDDGGKADNGNFIASAAMNEDYFAAYIVLNDTKVGNNKIIIDSINVTSVGNADGLTGMAKALRIAIFVASGEDKPTLDTQFGADTLKFVGAPYANLTYDNNGQSWTTGGDDSDLSFIKGVDQVKASEKTVDNDATYADMETAKASTLTGWTAGTKGANDDNGPTTGNFEKADLSAITLGTLDVTKQSKNLFIKLVVWFEGEDPACLNRFAGGGATIVIKFGLDEVGA